MADEDRPMSPAILGRARFRAVLPCMTSSRLVQSTPRITQRADVGRRTFFRYFPAKESVLFHDIDAQIQATIDSLTARPENEPPFEALIRVLRDSASRFSADLDKRMLLAKVAHECDNLLVHHRAVIMRRLEDTITAEIPRRSGGPADDL